MNKGCRHVVLGVPALSSAPNGRYRTTPPANTQFDIVSVAL